MPVYELLAQALRIDLTQDVDALAFIIQKQVSIVDWPNSIKALELKTEWK